LSRALIVEDHEDTAALVASIVRRICDIDVAHSLSAALEYLSTGTYDAIVYDIGLPDADSLIGVQAVASHAPVVVCTGTDYTREQIEAAGAKAVLYKPIRAADLTITLRGMLGAKPVTGEVQAAGEAHPVVDLLASLERGFGELSEAVRTLREDVDDQIEALGRTVAELSEWRAGVLAAADEDAKKAEWRAQWEAEQRGDMPGLIGRSIQYVSNNKGKVAGGGAGALAAIILAIIEILSGGSHASHDDREPTAAVERGAGGAGKATLPAPASPHARVDRKRP